MKPVDPARLQRALDRCARLSRPADRTASAVQELAMAGRVLGVGPLGSRAYRLRRMSTGCRRSATTCDCTSAGEAGSSIIRWRRSRKDSNPELFVRLHRSAIVRRDFITGFTRNQIGSMERPPRRRDGSSPSGASIRTASGQSREGRRTAARPGTPRGGSSQAVHPALTTKVEAASPTITLGCLAAASAASNAGCALRMAPVRHDLVATTMSYCRDSSYPHTTRAATEMPPLKRIGPGGGRKIEISVGDDCRVELGRLADRGDHKRCRDGNSRSSCKCWIDLQHVASPFFATRDLGKERR